MSNFTNPSQHFPNDSPLPSWDSKFHSDIKSRTHLVSNYYKQAVEELQVVSGQPSLLRHNAIINEVKIDNKYRYDAQIHIEKILKPYEHVLDVEWKDLKDDGIVSEWVQVPNDGWEKRETRKTILYFHGGGYYMCSKDSVRHVTSSFVKETGARIFAINYRLAPQNQFPAALQDALAAYLYLLNPPKDARFDPINPKNIVISGSSAGGSLGIALGLAIRDAGLPSCAGIVGFSPWVDLTFSTSSVMDDESYDYINKRVLAYFRHKPSPVSMDFKEKADVLKARIKKQNSNPKIWHDSFDIPERVQYYAPNEGLAIPYVSPLLAESLCDLPSLLLTAGGIERFRDEIIYFAYRCAEPTKYKGPSYNAGKLEKSPFQTPTNTTLEVYEEMPHDFQVFEHKIVEVSYEHASLFINKVIDTSDEPLPPSSYSSINDKGDVCPLKEHYKEILKSKTIGIVPSKLLENHK